MIIKYMGTADVRRIEKGADWGGRLAKKLDTEIVWDWSNHHTVDTDELGLPEEVVELILEDPNMKDVTGMKRIPAGGAETMWKGVGGGAGIAVAPAEAAEEESAPPKRTRGKAG